MHIYLAGGISANLKPLLQRIYDRGGGGYDNRSRRMLFKTVVY